jgi:hypothetical protein
MGKTFRRDNQFRPKKQGKTFTKDKNWKKNKHKPLPNKELDESNIPLPNILTDIDNDI